MLFPSCVADLDATLWRSYPGKGQLWYNLIRDAAYNFNIGATAGAEASDPAFTGTVGRASSYFLHDGGDYNVLAGSNPSFVGDWHKTTGGTDFTVALAFRYASNGASQILLGTKITGASVGILLFVLGTDNNVFLTQRGGTAAVNADSNVALVSGTDYLLICSHSHAHNRSRFWINTTTGVEVAHTFNTTVAAANNALTLWGGNTGAEVMPNATRSYHCSLYNEEFTDAKAATLIAALNKRHNRVYA